MHLRTTVGVEHVHQLTVRQDGSGGGVECLPMETKVPGSIPASASVLSLDVGLFFSPSHSSVTLSIFSFLPVQLVSLTHESFFTYSSPLDL